jgi:Apea-like HEPN
MKEMSNRSLDDIRATMQAWQDDATVAISRNPNAYIVTSGTERWMHGSDGSYRRIFTQEYAWAPEEADLEQLPTYFALREAAAASTVVGPLMSHDIGTAVGLSSFDFKRFTMAILPRPAEFMSGQLSSFESRYDNLTKLLTAEEAEYLVIYFMQNVSFELDRVELEPDLAIERLAEQEVQQALGFDILRPFFGNIPVYQPMESAAFGLKKTWHLPRIVGGGITLEEREQITELLNPNETAEELLQCLALLSDRGVHITGTIMRRIDDDFSIFADAQMFRSLPAPRPPYGDGLRLDEAKCTELQQLWRIAHNESFPANKALALAIRRLGFAAQRERVEDRLIDVMIAAEAFYLTDSGDAKDRGELKYRLALRAAVWSTNTLDGWSRRQVFDHMRRAYDLRSVVAHGGEPKAKDIKIKGQQVGLPELVRATEEIVRAALYKAMKQIPPRTGRLSIVWEDLVLLASSAAAGTPSTATPATALP